MAVKRTRLVAASSADGKYLPLLEHTVVSDRRVSARHAAATQRTRSKISSVCYIVAHRLPSALKTEFRAVSGRMSQSTRSLAKMSRMRILAVPLTSTSYASGQHTYYHFQTPPAVNKQGKPSLWKKATGELETAYPNLMLRARRESSRNLGWLWKSSGRQLEGDKNPHGRLHPPDSPLPQLRTFKYGERVVDRIDFEELVLKSMDPSLGPSLKRLGHPDVEIKEKDDVKVCSIVSIVNGRY